MNSKGVYISFLYVFVLLVTNICNVSCTYRNINQGKNEKNKNGVPGVYVFGDSLVDVGNNNYLPLSLDKANFPHNGIDFPTGPTGRFSNDKNAADFVVEKLGLPSPPPYLSLSQIEYNQTITTTGVSFASAGSGILNSTCGTPDQAICLAQQVDYYSTIHQALVLQLGSDGAKQHLSDSIYGIFIGSNDLIAYFESNSKVGVKAPTPQDYVDSMLSILNDNLQQLYTLDARKFAIFGLPAIGCSPKQRTQNETQDCRDEINVWASKYNDGLKSLLQTFKSQFQDINYSYYDTYDALIEIIEDPDKYGFTEIKSACCGMGELRANIPCLPTSMYCPDRDDHIFWDFYHPAQKTVGIFIDMFFSGTKHVSPVNIKQLISL